MRTNRLRQALWQGGPILLLAVLILTRPEPVSDVIETPVRGATAEFLPVDLDEPLGTTHVVAPNGDFRTITDAIEEAVSGDRIVVRGGVHEDTPIRIDESVELIGEDGPIIDVGGRGGGIIISAPDVVVMGFVVRNIEVSHVRDHAAIRVEGTTGCRIEGNRIEDGFFGIYLAQTTDCAVRGNTIRASGTRESNSANGIHLWNSQDILIEDNDIAGHRDGIYLEFASGSVIRDNVSSNNLRYGLHFMFSDEAVYERNVFTRNGAGVAVMYSREVRMAENRFADNWGTAAYGLLLKDVRDSEVVGNHFRQNTIAIFADGADRLHVEGNRIEHNGWAVKVQANSLDNVFTGNDFLENTFDVVTNSRRTSSTFNGNHWSRYAGYDLTGDGVGDVPFRPVRLFSYIVETRPMAVILLRSFFVDLLDLAERVLPILTPEMLMDEAPSMKPVT